ncbi:S-layer homology domain-containing protein [Cohnella sp. LGH]|uniref:S-layer homology domain-containing protein n=1 Tax=Cohnella sp. LGH TaxID=1619153 RepID=UPI001ADA3253|nr:S-layer homology domain-containing protein [Cohnella sp. LGH]QTH42050.1 S-layer homology domain-containing protein [Cohnella sp. LGH]
MNSKLKKLFCTSFAFLTLAQSAALTSAADYSPSANSTGRWMSGEYHTHTVQSADASESFMKLENVLDAAFREDMDNKPAETVTSLVYGDPFDYIVLADHLRDSPRDPDGNNKATARWEAIKDQQDKIKALQAAGKYQGKFIYSGFEWDMMGLDHGSVGIIDSMSDEVPIDAIHQFEWLYSYDTAPGMFHANEAELWGPRPDKNTLKPDKNKTLEALNWLKTNYPESYVLLNHPSRHNGDSSGVVTIEDIRKMNDAAPDIVFGMEGLPGNQMAASKNRAELADIYGGADVMVGKLGGMWDALLGEGRRFWNFTNSDFHFKVSSNRSYSSGYWPSEYSRNMTWVEGNTFKDVVEGMRSGKSYAVYGDLIHALVFKASGNGNQAEMGENLQVTEGDLTTISIRFKSPERNNYAPISPHPTSVTNEVKVDHVDLISGEVTGKLEESQYASNTTNATTQVVKRFTEADWGQPDAEGYYTVSYKVPADKSRYYRLRGTNLGTDVAGFTANGEPLQDQSYDYSGSVTPEQNEERFNNINDRNYTGLWFYSNPIFVDVAAYSDEQAIADTIANVTSTLGDTSAIVANVPLPAEGVHGARIEWKSSNENVIRIDNNMAIVTRPSSGSSNANVTLTATVSRGDHSQDKPYTVIVKAYPSGGTPGNGSSGGGGGNASKPNVSVTGAGGTAVVDSNGHVTITPDQGYKVKEVTINGVSKGALTQLTGVKSTDQVVVTFEKISEQPEKPTEPTKPTVPSTPTFNDISKHWAASSINYVVEHSLFTGTAANTFSPDATMTRGMLVTIMHRLAGKPEAGTHRFQDVKANDYYKEAVAWASQNNIVNGIDPTRFAPNQAITREQLAQILYNYAKANKLNVSANQSLAAFTDEKKISKWAVDAMKWSVSNQLLSGKGNGSLDPKGAASRAEVATIIHRFMVSFNL